MMTSYHLCTVYSFLSKMHAILYTINSLVCLENIHCELSCLSFCLETCTSLVQFTLTWVLQLEKYLDFHSWTSFGHWVHVYNFFQTALVGAYDKSFFQYQIILDNFLDTFDNDIDIDNFYHSITFMKTYISSKHNFPQNINFIKIWTFITR